MRVSLKVNVDFPSSRVGDAGRFDNPPENTFDRVLPVVYGLVTKYSIPAVEFTSTPTGGGEVDVCLAAHVIDDICRAPAGALQISLGTGIAT